METLTAALREAKPGEGDGIIDAAVSGLTSLGSRAHPAVPALLQTAKSVFAKPVLRAIVRIGNAARPSLIRGLRNEEARIRATSATLLGRIPVTDPAVLALAEALRDDDVEVRAAAATALGHLGPSAKSAISALIRTLRDRRAVVRAAAADSLGRVGAPTPKGLKILLAAMDDDYVVVRRAATTAYGPSQK